MIVSEIYETREDGTQLIRTVSDQNKYIHKIGTTEIYAEAIDVAPVRFQYEETDRDIEPPEPEEDSKEEATPELDENTEEDSGNDSE